jgi:ABC-type glycerol-3-phosphate transport system substrate-binding protein
MKVFKKIAIIFLAVSVISLAACTSKVIPQSLTNINGSDTTSTQPGDTVSGSVSEITSTTSGGSSNTTSKGISKTTTSSKTTVSSGNSQAAIKGTTTYVPNFKGATVTIHFNGYTPSTVYSSITGQYLKQRVTDIQNKLNCKLVLGSISTETDATNMLAGKPPCDIYATNGPANLAKFVKQGLLYPLDNLGIDLNNSNYDSNVVNAGFINGKHYAANRKPEGVYKVEYLSYTAVNTDVLKTIGYDMSKLNDLQNKGQWNWDNLKMLCDKVTTAKNADGTPITYGAILWDGSVMSGGNQIFASTNGSDFIVKNGNKFNVNTSDSVVKAFQFLQPLYANKEVKELSNWTEFRNGKALFFVGAMGWTLRVNWAFGGMSNLALLYMPKGPDAPGYITPQAFVEPYGIVSSSVAGNTQKAKDLAVVLDMYCAPLLPSSNAAQIENQQLQALVNDKDSLNTLTSSIKSTHFIYSSYVDLSATQIPTAAKFSTVYKNIMQGQDVKTSLNGSVTAWNNAIN